ncbi:ferredoxin [Vagococcus vulneris]|uniref:4Fe-4S ferredoxin-type domain-containing protein n=1 Tax=Vagococcus vulneris TaxID=1977869 RepID=A0A430A1Z0_9ENTE|nr:ferredoxin [Vagococcus vulneris]RSU00450.1 hypothetical protein CBF37_00105 [Vagococcus vulneris]
MICKIIPEKCIACGLCQIKAPAVFDYYDNGIVKFKDTDEKIHIISTTKDNLSHDLLEAYKHCPTRAIVLEENT